MNYYQFHIGDFRSGTINMSRQSRWIYRDMMDVYYDSEKPLPLDMDVLCDMLGVSSDEEKEIVRRHLRFKFDMTDDGYTHEVCEKVIAEYRSKADVARANGKLGGRPKGNQNKPSGFQSGSYEVSFCKQGETGSQTNHKPLTKNQEPKELEACVPDAQSRSDYFDRFWKLYPKKKSKADAEKAWSKVKMNDEFFTSIIQALSAQCSSQDWTKDGGKYVPLAGTWIRGKRWEDEVSPAAQKKHNGFAQADYTAGVNFDESGNVIL